VTEGGEWRQGWRVVLAALCGNGVGFTMVQMTSGIFIIPIQQEFGISRTAASIGPWLGLAVALLTPVAALFVDRKGPRGLAIAGLCGLASSYALLAVLPPILPLYVLLACLVALSGTIANPMIYCRGVATWFRRNAGLAFGLTMSGTSVVAAVIAPFLSRIVEQDGWRTGIGLYAAMVSFIGLPLVLLWFRAKPDDAAVQDAVDATTGLTAAQAAHTRQFWLLIASFGCATLAIGGMISQLYPILVASNYTAETAALTVSFYAASMGIGRIGAGFLIDRFNPTLVAGSSLALAASGSFLLLHVLFGGGTPELAYLAAFLLGWGQGAEGDFIGFFTQRLFGLKAFGLIYSWFNLAVGCGLAIGGLLFAAAFDRYGNYEFAVMMNGGLWTTAAILMVLVRVPRKA
jgi:MFS family permease